VLVYFPSLITNFIDLRIKRLMYTRRKMWRLLFLLVLTPHLSPSFPLFLSHLYQLPYFLLSSFHCQYLASIFISLTLPSVFSPALKELPGSRYSILLSLSYLYFLPSFISYYPFPAPSFVIATAIHVFVSQPQKIFSFPAS
jgi:hypothetical protein